jgi:NAD(P)-dependent dehydrogenase (short-subunit alcohol dehydrogenase family)
MQTALVTGADRYLGLEFCRELLEQGLTVCAGKFDYSLNHLEALREEYPDRLTVLPLDCGSDESVARLADALQERGWVLDMLIHNAAVLDHQIVRGDITGAFEFLRFDLPFDVNALGAVRLTERLAPLMRESKFKRLCYVSSEASSVAVSHRTEPTSYGMSKTALNMAVRVLSQRLRPEGYTFRLFHPGWMKRVLPEGTVGLFEPRDSAQSALRQFIADRAWEDCLVLVDNEDAAWPF